MARGMTITGRDLHRWLRDMGIDVRVGRKAVLALIDGLEVPVPSDDKKVHLNDRQLSDLAKALDVPAKELSEAITGRRRPSAAKASSVPDAPPDFGPSRGEVVDVLTSVRDRAGEMLGWVRHGNRSQPIYALMFGAARVALRALDRAAAKTVDATAAVVDLPSPDDSKHKPKRYDPLTRGAGRYAENGPTVRAAKKGETKTRFQLRESGEVI